VAKQTHVNYARVDCQAWTPGASMLRRRCGVDAAWCSEPSEWSVRMRARDVLLLLAAPVFFLGSAVARAQAPQGGRVSGTVFDSAAGRPLVDALVQLVAAADPARVRSTRTDDRGRFAFDSIAPGSYLAGVLHPRFDSLFIRPPTRTVMVQPGRVMDAMLYLPSTRALRGAFCGAAALRDDAAVFIGRLRRAGAGGMPTTGRVRAEWGEFVIDKKGGRTERQDVEVTTTSDGSFALCGLPTGLGVAVRAWAGTDSSGVLELMLPEDGLLRRDLVVGEGSLATTGYLRGRVRLATGAPVAGARVAVRASGVEAVANDSGVFTLRALPLGTQALETQAVGYAPRRTLVDIADSAAVTTVDVVLEPLGQAIDTVRVNAARVPLQDRWLSGFEERRKLGHGHFLDEATIERTNPLKATDLLLLVPGVTVLPKGGIVFPRHQSIGPPCTPNVYIDGVLLRDADIDYVVSAREVRSVEVYTSAGYRPAEFTTPNGCGTIVIWRGMRKGTP
jgi:hypothetical protein